MFFGLNEKQKSLLNQESIIIKNITFKKAFYINIKGMQELSYFTNDFKLVKVLLQIIF